MTTNNTLMLFRRLYNNSPDKFNRFINTILEDSGLQLDTTVEFGQQIKGKDSIPDGMIQQESFKIIIEAKLHNQQNINQIINHWSNFKNEDKKIFLLIDTGAISKSYHDQIIDQLNIFNNSNHTDIRFASTTFKDICRFFDDIIEVYDLEMKALVADYENFCSESELIDNKDTKIRAVLTGQTFDLNIKYNIYYCPSYRSYQDSKYLGLYKDKAVKAIGEIVCITDAKCSIQNDHIETQAIFGTLNKEIDESIKKVIIEAKEEFGYSVEEGHRFFIVKQYYETEYIKHSKGGLMNTRYFDLEDIHGYNKKMTTEEVANLLKGKEWDV